MLLRCCSPMVVWQQALQHSTILIRPAATHISHARLCSTAGARVASTAAQLLARRTAAPSTASTTVLVSSSTSVASSASHSSEAPCIKAFRKQPGFKVLQLVDQLYGGRRSKGSRMFPWEDAVVLAAIAGASNRKHICKTCPFSSQCAASSPQHKQDALQSLLQHACVSFPQLQLDALRGFDDAQGQLEPELAARVLFHAISKAAMHPGLSVVMNDDRWPGPHLLEFAEQPSMKTKTCKKRQLQLKLAKGLDPGCLTVDHIMPKSKGGANHVFNYYMMSLEENQQFAAEISAEKVLFVGFWAAYVALLHYCWGLVNPTRMVQVLRRSAIVVASTMKRV